MSLWIERPHTYDVYVNGARVMVSDLTISQGIDQITTVATFDLVDQPTLPIEGDPVQVDWVNTASGTAITQFAGRIYAVDAESYPHRVGIIAQGPLGVLSTCLRQRSDGDLNLTGMTDGEAVEAVLAYCNITYQSADIDDAGYELGAQQAVYWHADGQTPASAIIDEIDRVFFSKLLDIGNGRVIRGFYNLASEATSGIRNYVRGSDSRLFGNRKTVGEITAIQNHWEVTGPTVDCGGASDGCQCTAHASAHTDNAILETWTGKDHARAAVQRFQSDLIQDGSLAAAVARRLMQWFNRTPIELTAEVQSEPQLYPCRQVSMRDSVYGIGLEAAQAFTLSRVEVRPESTTLTLVGGPPGSVGTVTDEIEELCNDVETSLPGGGDFTSPDFSDFPGLDPIDFTPFPDDGWIEIPPVTVPNTDDRFLNCTETDGMAGGAPGVEGYLFYPSVGGSLETLNWRVNTGAAQIAFHVPSIGADIDEIVKWGVTNAQLILNTTNPIASKSSANDVTFGTGPIIVVTFDVWFGEAGAEVFVQTIPNTGTGGTAQLVSDPGIFLAGTGSFGALLSSEAQTYIKAGLAEEHTCPHISLSCDNGGLRVEGGYPIGQWLPVSVAMDFAQFPMRIDLGGQDAGYMKDVECWGPDCQFDVTDVPCTHTSHTLLLALTGGTGTGPTDPHIKIRNLAIGHSTCTINPDYDDGGDVDS